MDNILKQLDLFYNRFMGTKIVPEIYHKYTDKYIMPKEEAERLLKLKLKPEIEITKENIKTIDSKIEELNKKSNEMGSGLTAHLSDPDYFKKTDAIVREFEAFNKERIIWSEIFDKLKLHRTLIFCGDYKRKQTESQKKLCKIIENSKIAKESVKEFIKFIYSLEEFKKFEEEYNKIDDKKELIKLSSQMIIKYAKTEFEINAITNINSKKTIMKSISILIKSIIKNNKKILDIADNLEKYEKEFVSSGYLVEDSLNMAKYVLAYLNELENIINSETVSIDDKEDIEKLSSELEKINFKNLISDLEYEIAYDLGESAKMYEEDRRKAKRFLTEVGVREGNFINKSILLNNLIFEKFPINKDDTSFIRESIIILYFYMRTYSIDSFAPLVLYTI